MEWLTVAVLLFALVLFGLGIRGLGSGKRAARGATGTLGSVLGILDSTGAPTRHEAAAAAEEQKQMRLEKYFAGPGDGVGPYGGRIRLPGPTQDAGTGPDAPHTVDGPPAPTARSSNPDAGNPAHRPGAVR